MQVPHCRGSSLAWSAVDGDGFAAPLSRILSRYTEVLCKKTLWTEES